MTTEYCGNVSDRMRDILNKNNFKISYKSFNTFYNKLKNTDHVIDKMSLSGVYKLDCECGAQYVGKTTRKYKQRLQEHRHSFIYNKPEKSNFAANLLNNHHPLNNNNFSIIKIINNKTNINTWEELEIFKSYKNGYNINEQLPNFNNPLFQNIVHINK